MEEENDRGERVPERDQNKRAPDDAEESDDDLLGLDDDPGIPVQPLSNLTNQELHTDQMNKQSQAWKQSFGVSGQLGPVKSGEQPLADVDSLLAAADEEAFRGHAQKRFVIIDK